MSISLSLYIYICIYIERETYISLSIYIYIYRHTYMVIVLYVCVSHIYIYIYIHTLGINTNTLTSRQRRPRALAIRAARDPRGHESRLAKDGGLPLFDEAVSQCLRTSNPCMASPGPAVRQQKQLPSPSFAVLKADLPTRLLLWRSVFAAATECGMCGEGSPFLCPSTR